MGCRHGYRKKNLKKIPLPEFNQIKVFSFSIFKISISVFVLKYDKIKNKIMLSLSLEAALVRI